MKEGLVRADGKYLYVVDDDIPVMLIDEAAAARLEPRRAARRATASAAIFAASSVATAGSSRPAGQPIPSPPPPSGFGMMWKWTWNTAWWAGGAVVLQDVVGGRAGRRHDGAGDPRQHPADRGRGGVGQLVEGRRRLLRDDQRVPGAQRRDVEERQDVRVLVDAGAGNLAPQDPAEDGVGHRPPNRQGQPAGRVQLTGATGGVARWTTSGRPGRGRVDESTSQAGTAKADRASRNIAEAATRRREDDMV